MRLQDRFYQALKNRDGYEKQSAAPADDAPSSNDTGGTLHDLFLAALKNRDGYEPAQSGTEKAEEKVTAPTGAVTGSGSYYKRPEFGTQADSLYNNAKALEPEFQQKQTALKSAEDSLKAAQGDVSACGRHLALLEENYKRSPSQLGAAAYNEIYKKYESLQAAYKSAYGTYTAAYEAYKPAEEAYISAAKIYEDYIADQQTQMQAWRSTIRDAGTVQAQIDEVRSELSSLRTGQTLDKLGNIAANVMASSSGFAVAQKEDTQRKQRIADLEAQLALLEEEWDWSEYYRYADLMANADFEKASRYKTTANGRTPELNGLAGIYTETGFDDLTYDYINRNEDARGKAMVNSIGDNTALLGLDKSYLEQMKDDEIAIFNYLYATKGADAAYRYTAYLTGDLNRRQRQEQEEYWEKYAEEHPVKASVFSVLESPAKGLSYLGQYADIVEDGSIDQNAGYNKFSNINSAIRGKVTEQVEKKWGKPGNFLYQTGMSMADFLMNTGITGGNSTLSMIIMGTGAAADTVIEAKDRGLNDAQAFTLGTVAGLAEAITEKYSIETLLDSKLLKDGTLKYILKNAVTEGTEEVSSSVINLVADLLVSQDQSQWRQSMDAYMADGKTEQEAFGLAMKDQLLSLGTDFLGGMLSGGVLSGGNAALQNRGKNSLKKKYGLKNVTENEAQDIINSGLERKEGTDSHQMATELQKKLDAGKLPTADELARLIEMTTMDFIEEADGDEDLEDDPEETAESQTVGYSAQEQIERNWRGENTQQAPFVTQKGQNVTMQNQNGTLAPENDTVTGQNVPLSVAEQIRTQESMNGGIINAEQREGTERVGAAQFTAGAESTGDGVLHGGGQRYDGAGAREQAGELAVRAGQAAQGRTVVDQRRAAVDRQNRIRSLRLPKVSSKELGLPSGTDARNLQTVPQQHWDAEMEQLAQRVYQETGKNVTYVMGALQIRGADGKTHKVNGVMYGESIIVRADSLRLTMEQIADHEAYHGRVDAFGGRLNQEIRRHIVETFGEEEFRNVVTKYVEGLMGVYDMTEVRTGAEYEAMMRKIEEEVFADAYAGINAFGAGADRFTAAVNQRMEQLGTGRYRSQENGVRETNGPPEERFSYAGENAHNADIRALETAKEQERLGFSNEVIRQQTGWFRGMDGKWRFELDDSGAYVADNLINYMTLGELLPGAEVFKAYPNLEDVSVVFQGLEPGVNASYDPRFDTIDVSYKLKNDPEAVRAAVLHEIQHIIQRWEGFTKGTNVGAWQKKIDAGFDSRKGSDVREAQEAEAKLQMIQETDPVFYRDMMELDAMAPDLPRGKINWDTLEQIEDDPPEWQAYDARRDELEAIYGEKMWDFNSTFYDLQRINKRPPRTATELYWDTAGEIEARNVAGRRNLTSEERKKTPPILGGEDTVFAEGVSWVNEAYDPETASIKEQLSSMLNVLQNMDPVASVTVPENLKDRRTAYNWAVELLKPTGYRVERQGFGTIWFDKDDINYGLNYADTPEEKAALALLPRILKRGIEIGRHGNHKLRQKETVTFAAPAFVNGTRVNMAAVVTVRNGRYYTHRIVLPNGTVFRFGGEKNNDAVQEPHRGVPTEGSLANATSTASINSILDGSENVKRTEAMYSVDDEVEQQKKPAAKKNVKPVAESLPIIAKKDLRNTMMNLFSIPDGSRGELGTVIDNYADRLLKNGSLTEQDRKHFFDRMYESGVMTVPADDYFALGRGHVKGGRIYIPENVKLEFGDYWNEIRRRAFGAGVYLTGDRGASGIDQWNQELAELLPGLFDTDETDMRSILERIVQVAEEGRDERLSLAEYTAKLAETEHQSEEEFLDNMERQMDWALRTFAEKAKLEIQLRDRTGKKIAQEREGFSKAAERKRVKDAQRRAEERQDRKEAAQRARDRKELSELQKKTLKQLQWLSKNRNRAPEELKATWDEVLGDIDLYAVSAANEMRWSKKYDATWKDLAQMYKDAMQNDPNFMPSKDLERIVARLDGTKIEDMDIGALQDLYKAAIGLRTEFYNRNNVINDEMQRLFAEVYTDAKREIEAAPGGFTGKVMDKFLNLDQLTAMNVLQRMGGWDPNGAFYSMAKQLEKGERDIRAYKVKAQKMLQEFLTEHEDWVKKADGQGKDAIWYEIEVPQLLELRMGDKPIFGPTVKVHMTPAQKVHMYLESKNVDNLRHMTGGRTFANKELYSQGKRQEALAQGRTIRLAPETVKALVSDLTAEEMELARLLDQYYNSFATKEINKISNILYGYDKAMGKNYAPIYTNRNYTKSEFGVFDVTAEGVGNLKGRQYAVNPSYNISALDAFERHVDQTARFCGMAIPARNWTTLMNWRERNNSTGDVITHKWGEESKRYISDLITKLQGGEEVKTDTLSAGLNKLQSNYISAIFGANPSIVLKQLGSIPLAGAYLDMKNAPTASQIKNIDRELISKYSQDLEWRTMGYTTPETKQLKENPNWTQTNKAFKFLFGGGAITAMDGWAASVLWPWAENKVRREHPELELGSKAEIDNGESAFYKKVAEEFENAMSRSQSVSDEIHQGSLRKSKNPITRAFTLFRSDSAQTYNALRQKIGEAQYFMRTGAKDDVVRTAKNAAGAAFVALLINAAWAEGINFLMALWKNKGKYYRDDEDELTAESVASEMVSGMLGSFAGISTGGEELYELIGNIVTGDTWYGIETPGMEQMNDMIDVLVESGTGMRDIVAGGWDIVKNGGDLGAYFSEHSGQINGSIKDLASAAAMYLPGLPVSNVEAYLVGGLKWISPELGAAYDDLFADEGKDDLAGTEGDVLASRLGRILDKRRLSESAETTQALAGLYESGFKTAVPSDIPSSVSINGEQRKLGVYQQQAYDTIWTGTVAGALDDIVESDAFEQADESTRAKMLSRLYDYASAVAKAELFDDYEMESATEKNAAIVAAGASVAECMIWNTVTADMKSGEKAAELASWDLGETAKREIFYSKISDSREDSIEAVLSKGLSFDQFLKAYSRYSNINAADMSAGMKATEFAHWTNAQNFTEAQAAVLKDELSYFNMTPAQAGRYDEFVESGMGTDDAYELTEQLDELEPVEGEDKVTDLQRWRVCVEFSDNVEDQLTALYCVMSDSQYGKVELANSFGVEPAAYLDFYEARARFDEDQNGTFTQAEYTKVVSALDIDLRRKAALWQIVTGAKSAKNNPFSVSVGEQVLAAKDSSKNSSDTDEESETFSDAIMKQLLGQG